MDLFHSWGVQVAVYLQTQYGDYEGWFKMASSVADLHTTFYCFFPVWFYLRRDVGIKLIWVAVIGDWLNLVLKWVLFGERPYWWVHDTSFYGIDAVPALKQFPITCETGPGSPSGHAMGSAAVGYVMTAAVLAVAEKSFPSLLYRLLQVGLWTLLCVLELLVGMSRVYMAAHFPHQIMCGVIAGIMVAQAFSRVQWIYGASLRKYFYTTLFLLSSAVAFEVLLKALGIDLLWTLEKAQKWCVKPEWVLIDSAPFASLLRNMGTLLGLGLGLHLPLYTESKKSSSASFRLGCITISLILLQVLDRFTFSSRNQAIFYLLSFCKSAVALLIPIALVPGGLSWIFPGNSGVATLKHD